ncbi:hypothetical protein DFH09DRAFT_1080471 [Mycena vulgaris]|nr:hypothetical protein DFH09DRAFT_1080471 [Mycena vulgaris]
MTSLLIFQLGVGLDLFTEIDLIYKSKTIAQLGDGANESSLLPALLCAERVVSVETGSSFFTLAAALIYGRPYRLRTIGIAAIPPIFAVVASRFCPHAHQAISRTTPVLWCLHVDGPSHDLFMGPATVDFPAVMGQFIPGFLEIYRLREHWLVDAGLSAVTILAAFVFRLVAVSNVKDALLATLAMAFSVAVAMMSVGTDLGHRLPVPSILVIMWIAL